MNVTVDALNAGTKVYVALGYITVKCGSIVAHRLTIVGQKCEVEYKVRWYGAGDRPDSEEWFPSIKVFATPIEAFQFV